MKKRILFLSLLLCVTSLSLNADNAIKIESIITLAGSSEVEVRVLVDNDDPLLGISLAGEFDNGLILKRIELGAALLALNVQDEYFETIEEPDYFGAAIITDFNPPYDFENNSLAPGTDQHCFSIFFDVDPTITTNTNLTINLKNGLGSPPVENVFSVWGVTVKPDLIEGIVTVVAAPVVTSVSTDRGPASGGTPITITGQNFTADTAVMVGGSPLENKNVVNLTTISGNMPSHAAGTVNITVSNTYGRDTLDNAFTYFSPPAVVSVDPNQGHGDVDITIMGTAFTSESDMTISYGSVPITSFTVVSDTEITCHIPSCPNPELEEWIPITVTTTGGSGTLDQAYLCLKLILFRRGDANCDSKADLSDAVSILLYLFAGRTFTCLDALDSNDDGNLNLADSIYLLSYLFNDGPAPNAPYPDLGEDPTDDAIGCADTCGN